jgi:HSP20 family protein
MTNLVRWEPFQEIEKVFGDDWFAPVNRAFRSPAVDLYETDNEVVAEISIPGMDPKKVNVEIENNVLHFRSEEQTESESSGKDYYRKELRRGMFARSIALPTEVDADKVTATSEKGILKIVMPKSEKVKPKKVEIDIKD